MQKLSLQLLLFFLAFANSYVSSQELKSNWWLTNRNVRSALKVNDKIYIGGQFEYIGPKLSHGALIDSATKKIDSSFAQPNGKVRACVSDGNGGWFIGGEFTKVNGIARNFLAHIYANGTLSSWNPNPNNFIYVIERKESILYVGGEFTTIGGLSRNKLASMDTSSFLPTSWSPNPNNSVHAIHVRNNTLHVGGKFTSISATPRNRLAAFNLSTGIITSWNPNCNNSVYAIASNKEKIFIGGYFNYIAGSGVQHVAAVDTITGSASNGWYGYVYGDVVTCLAVGGNKLFIGGIFGGVTDSARSSVAALNLDNGLSTAWTPELTQGIPTWRPEVYGISVQGQFVNIVGDFRFVRGQARSFFAQVDSINGYPTALAIQFSHPVRTTASIGSKIYVGGDFTSGGGRLQKGIAALDPINGKAFDWNPNLNGDVNSIEAVGDTVYVGGNFTSVNGVQRNRLAAFDNTTGNLLGWNPDADNSVEVIKKYKNNIYIGGSFNYISGQYKGSLAAVSPITGSPTTWNPNTDGTVLAFAFKGDTAFIGGGWSKINSFSRSSIGMLNLTTGALIPWSANVNGTVNSLQIDKSKLYVGGYYTSIGGQLRNGLAALNVNNASSLNWNPNTNNAIFGIKLYNKEIYAIGQFSLAGGQTRSGIVAIDTTLALANTWNVTPAPPSLANTLIEVIDGQIFFGGHFMSVNGEPRSGFAVLSIPQDSILRLCPPSADTVIRTFITGSTFIWQIDTGSGFRNIIPSSFYTGVNSQTLHLVNSPSSFHNYTYRCIVDGALTNLTRIKFENKWAGTTNNSWENAINWSCGVLPDNNTDVIIGSGSNVMITSNVIIGSLQLSQGSTLTIAPGYSLTTTR